MRACLSHWVSCPGAGAAQNCSIDCSKSPIWEIKEGGRHYIWDRPQWGSGAKDGDVQRVSTGTCWLEKQTPTPGLLKHPSACWSVLLHPVGCCAMADTPAETTGLTGRMERAIDAKVTEDAESSFGIDLPQWCSSNYEIYTFNYPVYFTGIMGGNTASLN